MPAAFFYDGSDQSDDMLDDQGYAGDGNPAGKAQQDGAQSIADESTDIRIEADGAHGQDDGKFAGGA